MKGRSRSYYHTYLSHLVNVQSTIHTTFIVITSKRRNLARSFPSNSDTPYLHIGAKTKNPVVFPQFSNHD